MRALVPLATALCVLAFLPGCSGGGSKGSAQSAPTTTAEAQPPATTAAAPKPSARQQQEKIVRAWSALLNVSDFNGIAKLFAVPAIIAQGPYEYRFTTRKQIALWHSGLPCAGKIVSITYAGRFATAVFRLADRGSHPCDAPGGLAAARFEIVRGKIVSWRQVDVPQQPTETGPTA